MSTESDNRLLQARAWVYQLVHKIPWFTMGLVGLLLLMMVFGVWHQVTTAASDDIIIYGVNQFEEIAEINLSSGTVKVVGTLAFGSQAADQDHNTGYVYYFDRTENADEFAYWDPATQTNTHVATYIPPLGYYPKRLAFAPDGDLYLMDADDKNYIVRTDNGAITPQGQVTGLVTGSRGGTGDTAFTPEGTLYLATYGNLYTVNLSTNEATAVFTNMFSGIGDGVWTGLAYCDGYLYGSAVFFDHELSTIHRIDPHTGALSEIFTSEDIAFNDLTSCPASDTPPATPTATGTSTPTNTVAPPTATATNTAAAPTATNTAAPATPTTTSTAVTPTSTNTAMPPTATETTTPTSEPSAEPTATNTWAPPTATPIIDATAESPDEPGATGTPRPAAYHQYVPLVLTSP